MDGSVLLEDQLFSKSWRGLFFFERKGAREVVGGDFQPTVRNERGVVAPV